MINSSTCTLRVTATDRDVARVSVGGISFQLAGRSSSMKRRHASRRSNTRSAPWRGEVVSGLRDFAWRRRIDVDQIEAIVTGELENPLAYLEVVGESGRPRIARVHLKVFVASPDEQAVRRIWEEMLDRLPLVCTLREAVRLELELTCTG